MCAICSGKIFITEQEPYKQIPCYHCGNTKMFINETEEQVIDRIKRKKQTDLPFEK